MRRTVIGLIACAGLIAALSGCAVDTTAPAYAQAYPYPYAAPYPYGPAYGGMGFSYDLYGGGRRHFYHHREFDHSGHPHGGHWGGGHRGGHHH